eukprot:3500329-Pyramimonas_sp.AAC.1
MAARDGKEQKRLELEGGLDSGRGRAFSWGRVDVHRRSDDRGSFEIRFRQRARRLRRWMLVSLQSFAWTGDVEKDSGGFQSSL